MNEGFSVKLFIGSPLHFLLRGALNKSPEWKRDQWDQKSLIQIHHEGHDYIGILSSNPALSTKELKELESAVKSKILSYCPDLKPSQIQLCLFPQLYLH